MQYSIAKKVKKSKRRVKIICRAQNSHTLTALPTSYETCTKRTGFNPSLPYGKHRVPVWELHFHVQFPTRVCFANSETYSFAGVRTGTLIYGRDIKKAARRAAACFAVAESGAKQRGRAAEKPNVLRKVPAAFFLILLNRLFS